MLRQIKQEIIEHEKVVDDDEINELEHLRKLFIGGLSPVTTEDSLKSYYEQWGRIVDVVVMREPATKRSRGFGFVTYSKSYMVDSAQDNRPHVVDGKRVEAKRALPRPDRETREANVTVKKLFVGGLKDNHDEECIEKYFSQFGSVIQVKILADKTTGKRRGFAFIEFDDYDAVDKAILKPHHSLKYVTLDVKKAVFNEKTRAKISNPAVSQTTEQNYYQQQPMNNGSAMNYNNWGPPPQNYGYNQQYPPPQNWNNWYYPQNSWNGPQQQPYWNQGWGSNVPMSNGPSTPMPQQYSASDVNNWNYVQPNFGGGYQQNFGGGPTKNNDLNSNRMNPYNGSTVQSSANNYQQGYNGYNNGPGPNMGAGYVQPTGGRY